MTVPPEGEPEAPTTAGVTAKRGRGRPRDPGLEERALLATLEVFGEKGWAGLTFDEVAARARVGKSSLYLRWATKELLLADALRRTQEAHGIRHEDEAEAADGPGSTETEPSPTPLRTYLVEHAMRRADLYLGPHGLAMLRLYVEARAQPEVFADIRKEAITSFVLEERRRVALAIETGDLPPNASPVQILDAIEGAVLMHVLVTPPELVDRVRRSIRPYVEELIDIQLRSNGATLSPPGS